ncbi:MAG TPA: sugar-binding protein, partial [Armatimonadota bacterium]|nr:sugar-binding protein [Armatimonadota bacterium]
MHWWLGLTALVVCILTAPGSAAWGQTVGPVREVICPLVEVGPEVDGALTDAAWESAAVLPLTLISRADGTDNTPPADVTTARVLHTADALYLGVTCAAGPAEGLRRGPHDGDTVWTGDHLELFLDPTPDTGDYLHLVMDRAGTAWDAQRASDGTQAEGVAWNGDWRVETAQTAEGWTAEIEIPLASLSPTPLPPGTMWRMKLGRDGGRDGPIMWPQNPTRSFHAREADGVLYFTTDSLLINGDFETGEDRNGAPSPWTASLTSAEVNNAPQGEVETVEGGLPPGHRALRFRKLGTALYWPQVWSGRYALEPGGTYEFSIMARGTLTTVNLRGTAYAGDDLVKLASPVKVGLEFARVAFSFVVPEGTEGVAVGLSAPAGAAGEVLYDNAVLRRTLPTEEAARRAFMAPDWSPDPDPVHGLESLMERAGHKPWDLFWREDHLLTWPVRFRDRRFGTELWLLDNSPDREFVVTASIWPGWNADGSVLYLPGDRMAGTERRRGWLSDTRSSSMRPHLGGMP